MKIILDRVYRPNTQNNYTIPIHIKKELNIPFTYFSSKKFTGHLRDKIVARSLSFSPTTLGDLFEILVARPQTSR